MDVVIRSCCRAAIPKPSGIAASRAWNNQPLARFRTPPCIRGSGLRQSQRGFVCGASKASRSSGVRLGNWLTHERCQAADPERLRDESDRTLLAMLLAFGLRQDRSIRRVEFRRKRRIVASWKVFRHNLRLLFWTASRAALNSSSRFRLRRSASRDPLIHPFSNAPRNPQVNHRPFPTWPQHARAETYNTRFVSDEIANLVDREMPLPRQGADGVMWLPLRCHNRNWFHWFRFCPENAIGTSQASPSKIPSRIFRNYRASPSPDLCSAGEAELA
jgi:hypothetical protein